MLLLLLLLLKLLLNLQSRALHELLRILLVSGRSVGLLLFGNLLCPLEALLHKGWRGWHVLHMGVCIRGCIRGCMLECVPMACLRRRGCIHGCILGYIHGCMWQRYVASRLTRRGAHEKEANRASESIGRVLGGRGAGACEGALPWRHTCLRAASPWVMRFPAVVDAEAR